MESKRAILAIAISMIILFGYQYFFVPSTPINKPAAVSENAKTAKDTGQSSGKGIIATTVAPQVPVLLAPAQAESVESAPLRPARDITVETSLYKAVVSEAGGGIKSFKLKEYRESLAKESEIKELIRTADPHELPFYFSWGVEPGRATVPVLGADQENVTVVGGGEPGKSLSMVGDLVPGLAMTRTLIFKDGDYTIDLTVNIRNNSQQAFQGAPYLTFTHRPFAAKETIFTGPAIYQDKKLQEIKVDDLKKEGAKTFGGNISWAAYEDTYFMSSVMPQQPGQHGVSMTLAGDDKVTTVLSGAAELIQPGASREYHYLLYMGPKKLAILKQVGHDLERIVDFGWWDMLARPLLYLLNFFNGFVHNYGVAIILLTILIKLLFWPISHKGMQSMKTMQKLQPKMAKLREKYKDDKERLNQEMLQLYQTYKINPLSGCLPMLLQIPVFFALYKVLLQAIELRHAPFMLWISDLSAPDRLGIGFDIPWLGGIPVLTLLMGASMFLQQKMTPNQAANPEMAKVMTFLPIIFTFMFLNFASGLVLYWLFNNLLSIAQQHVINRQQED
ncbi:MAG: hypothetical protein A2511_02300 [Deltaproteobacteria bacterium RIFOXYD12_FULL_50_9]|nr:MAG: hypothetical protein A2511_02300 [Deltaproteobacteria bacterium RIFOXYD12_FULL_50_9]